jgi:ATP-dependent 26S proteasome regulatory subunit
MLQTLINSNIPLIFVETDEPERFKMPDTDKDLIGIWKPTIGIQYRIGNTFEKIMSTNSIESAMEYLARTNKKWLMIFHGEPDYEKLIELPDYHTVIFLHSEFKEYVGAVRISLPLPDKEEYFNAFQKIIKPKQNKKLLEDFAKKAQGMKLRDASNCFRYSYHTNTDFLKNKYLFTHSSFLDIVNTKNTFKDLGGFEDFKEWFNERKFWYKQDTPRQKGVILAGPSGVGKSLCASCLGNEAELPLYKFDFTKVYDKYVGNSEEKIRQALKAIENTAPSCIWIEEIGRLFSNDNIQSNIAHHQVLAILLEWMQEHDKNIFIVATANNTNNIPKELIRPGRFNKIYEAKYPNKDARKKIFEIYLKKYDFKEYDLDKLSDLGLNLPGAEIEAMIEEIIIKAKTKTKEEMLKELV